MSHNTFLPYRKTIHCIQGHDQLTCGRVRPLVGLQIAEVCLQEVMTHDEPLQVRNLTAIPLRVYRHYTSHHTAVSDQKMATSGISATQVWIAWSSVEHHDQGTTLAYKSKMSFARNKDKESVGILRAC